MILDIEALEDNILLRLQDAVSDGMIAWAGVIGDESEADEIAKLPGIGVLFRRASFQDPYAIDVTRQMGTVEWSVYAAGKNLRDRGLRAGRLGATGAYHATMIAIKYLVGYNVADGFPLIVSSVDLAAYDPRAAKAMYEIGFRHEWPIVDDEYGD